MSELCVIAPIPHLREVSGRPYHLALTHLVPNQQYVSFMRGESVQGAHVILDNSAAERYSFDMEFIMRTAKAMRADEIVLPDKIQDAKGTVERVSYALGYIANQAHLEDLGEFNVRWMLVPQGRDYSEWYSCLSQLLHAYSRAAKECPVRFQNPPTLAFSIRYTQVPDQVNFPDRIIFDRVFPMLQRFHDEQGCPLHILGWDRSPWSYVPPLTAEFSIRSVDTAKPFWWANRNAKGRTKDFFYRQQSELELNFARDTITEFQNRCRTSALRSELRDMPAITNASR